jgi:hypothetical protein
MIITYTSLPKFAKLILLAILLIAGSMFTQAQSLLEKRVSVSFDHTRIADILQEVGKKGGFYFAYNDKLLPKDSLVTFTVNNQTVAGILTMLFHNRYEITELKYHVVIAPPRPNLSFNNTDITNESNSYSISGLVIDERSGARLANVSVYAKQQLASTLTDEHGYFQLKFRAENPGQISLTASKLDYKDTSINFLQSVSVSDRQQQSDYDHAANKGSNVERTGAGRFFISAKQRIQSLNIPDFFAKRPFQLSLTPGLSSHGLFSPQVVNKFSLNLVGGYTAGVNGLEFGGLFNINRMNSRYLQLAGVFNLVGGTVTGLQAAGVHNRALDTVKGVQFAGFINKAEGQVSGMQVAALNNEARKLKGVQIGLVNRADTSQGASIGLVNIIGNGFYKVTLSANDLVNTNISLKTGTHGFYTIVSLGANIQPKNKLYLAGFGLGHDFMLSKNVYFSTEAHYVFANAGIWDDRLMQGKLLLNVQLSKTVSLLAGPTFNSYNSSVPYRVSGFKNVNHLPEATDGVYPRDHKIRNWIGWEAGIAFNSVFKRPPKEIDNSTAWYLGAAISAGVGWEDLNKAVYGAELFTMRDLGEHIAGTFSVGYTNFTGQVHYTNTYGIYSKSQGLIPVKAGIRLKTGTAFFIGGEVGEAFGLFDRITYNGTYPYETTTKPYRSLMYSVSAGFSFRSGLETSFKFEDYGLSGYYKQFALRLGYSLKLSK